MIISQTVQDRAKIYEKSDTHFNFDIKSKNINDFNFNNTNKMEIESRISYFLAISIFFQLGWIGAH